MSALVKSDFFSFDHHFPELDNHFVHRGLAIMQGLMTDPSGT